MLKELDDLNQHLQAHLDVQLRIGIGIHFGDVIVGEFGHPKHLFVFATKLPYYYVILSMALGAPWLTRWIQRSKLGYALLAIRENEEAAEAAGVNALGMKLRALAISSFLSALGGTFSAQYFAYIDPSLTFGPSMSIQGLLQAIAGGAGTALGSLGRDRRLDRAQRRHYKTRAPDSAPGMRSPLEYRSTEPVLL
jgi:branched-subunit amino acid ABC-type transport system permease component